MNEYTLAPPKKPATAVISDIHIPIQGTRAKTTDRYFYTNQITQVNLYISFKNSLALALDRLKIIERLNGIDDQEIPNVIFDNTKEALIKLSSFLDFLKPDEVGPSSYDTILCNFENDDKSLLVDIGKTSIAYIFSDKSDQIISQKSKIDDEDYWHELISLFLSEFIDGR